MSVVSILESPKARTDLVLRLIHNTPEYRRFLVLQAQKCYEATSFENKEMRFSLAVLEFSKTVKEWVKLVYGHDKRKFDNINYVRLAEAIMEESVYD